MLLPEIFKGKGFDLDEFHPDGFFRDFPIGQHLKTDIQEFDDRYEMKIDFPGYEKEDINIQLDNNCLFVSAEKNSESEEKDEKGNYIRRERYVGSCSRTYAVGEGVTEEDIKAVFDNGVLKITINKKEETVEDTSKTISIE